MLDIKFIRENPDAVKENIKKKFQEQKLPLVDQVLELTQRTAVPSRRPRNCAPPATPRASRWAY